MTHALHRCVDNNLSHTVVTVQITHRKLSAVQADETRAEIAEFCNRVFAALKSYTSNSAALLVNKNSLSCAELWCFIIWNEDQQSVGFVGGAREGTADWDSHQHQFNQSHHLSVTPEMISVPNTEMFSMQNIYIWAFSSGLHNTLTASTTIQWSN